MDLRLDRRGRGRRGAALAGAAAVRLAPAPPHPARHRRPLTGFAGASFPSGHAAAAAAGYACFALLLGRGRSLGVRAGLSGVAVAVAFAVSVTRVALGVHWLTDVVAGMLLGWGWFALCSLAVGGRALRLGRPVEAAERIAEEEVEDREDAVIENDGDPEDELSGGRRRPGGGRRPRG